MSDPLDKLESILRNANMKYERSVHNDKTTLISALLDAENDLRLDIISLEDSDGYDLKMVVYLDEIHREKSTEQLKATLEMNFLMALGRFAYHPMMDAVAYVADFPLNLLDDQTFQGILDEYFYFSSMYFERMYGGEKDMEGHD
ncbi:hypothetical protein J7K50_02535 [bacterium]|nr:hypothetical protein [bacterium]